MSPAGVSPWSLPAGLLLLGGAILAVAIRLMRRGNDAGPAAEVELEPQTRPSARRFFSWGDVVRFVARQYPNLSPALAEALCQCILHDTERPDFGHDWSDWIAENYDRLLERAEGVLEQALPKRDCSVLLDVDGAPQWVKAFYLRGPLGDEWQTVDGRRIHQDEVADWREISEVAP